MRLFVAIELDQAARDAIAKEQNRVKKALGGHGDESTVRWVRPEHIHLTLVFLGDVSEDRGQAVVEVMREPFRCDRFAVVFGGIGVFPRHGSPRVLWLGLKQGASEVVTLQHEVSGRLANLGIALEDRAFHPHLTLGRWRHSERAFSRGVEKRSEFQSHAGKRSDRQRIVEVDRSDEVARVNATDVTVLQSRLSSEGPTYITLCRTPLQGRAGPLQSQP
jgi:RNA 2',3'-cyclic 3'-phosphodiesterase